MGEIWHRKRVFSRKKCLVKFLLFLIVFYVRVCSIIPTGWGRDSEGVARFFTVFEVAVLDSSVFIVVRTVHGGT